MSSSRRASVDLADLIPRKYIPEKNNQIKKSIAKVLPKYVVKQVKEILKRQRKSSPTTDTESEYKEGKEQAVSEKDNKRSNLKKQKYKSEEREKPIGKNNKKNCDSNRNTASAALKDNIPSVAETIERLEKRKQKRQLVAGTAEFFNWYRIELDRLSRTNQSDAYWKCVVELSSALQPATDVDIVSFYKSHLATPVVTPTAAPYPFGPVWLSSCKTQ